MKFEYYQVKYVSHLLSIRNAYFGQWRWRLKGANGEIVASGESYTSKQNCLKAIYLLIGTNIYTPVTEVTG